MAKRQKTIITKNKEIYTKLNSLNFLNEVVLQTVTDGQISKILKNINKHKVILQREKVGEYTLIRKTGPIDFSVYFRK